ncbi:radical SAM protein [Tissierella sp.]|uniref:radical SAM protein n=1 Tax=Tissierella sp. TaxID=41274 RepID=UPI0028A74DBF|nr:radical SAM protein [Tissierella sp.]
MDKKTYLPTSASFLVTEDCNLRCIYCFEKHNKNKMTKEVARKGLEYLCQNALKNGDDGFHAMIFGGEPLLMPDIVEEILSYGLELAKRAGIYFTASMVTNATILTTDIKRILNTYKNKVNLSVQLSIDGIKKVHDQYRITRDGKPTFDIIEKNIPEWKALFADNMDRLSVHGCSNHDTLPYLYENYIFFRQEWDIPRIWFMPIHTEKWTEKDINIYEDQLSRIAEYILEHCKNDNKIDEVLNYAPIDKCLRKDMFSNAPCGAGKHFITITATGELFPCHHLYFNDLKKRSKIGDLDIGIDEAKRRIWVDYDNSDLSCNKLDPKCDAYQCYRCIAEAYVQNGSILSIVDCGGPRCKMSKIERKIQLRIRKELNKMGLLNSNMEINCVKGNNSDNPDCLCDSRGISNNPSKKSYRASKTEVNICNCESNDYTEIFATALKILIDKVDKIDKGQEYLLEKLLK